MKRFSAICIPIIMILGLFLSGCSGSELDRGKELQSAMKRNDIDLSAAFLENAASFQDVSAFIKEWAGNAGLEIAAERDHYIIVRNPATDGFEDQEATTLQCHVDPVHIRKDLDLLSLSMACLLGPVQHGTIRLIVTENDEMDNFIGAQSLRTKSITDRHFIHMELGKSAMVYTSGSTYMPATLNCSAPRKKPEYTNAYTIDFTIPKRLNPYAFDKASSYPNPVEVIGNLLASAKSSGRLFEIASFTSESEDGYIPHRATAVVVIDDNNVESFLKRTESTQESMEKKFKELQKAQDKKNTGETEVEEEPLYSFNVTETALPANVLAQKGSDNIISLLYTLQTGIVSQSEENGDIQAVSYIQSISTAKNNFNLNIKIRGMDETVIKEISDTYLVTSGLCDVEYKPGKTTKMWSSNQPGNLSDFFFEAVDKEKESAPITLSRTECDIFGTRGENLDMILYRVNKDHRNTAIKYILAYLAGEDVPE